MNSQKSIEYSQGFVNESRETIVRRVKEELSTSRYEHVLRVEETAVELARKYDENIEKASVAALLHDFAKEKSSRFMKDTIINQNLDLDMLDYGNSIWHGPVGSYLAKEEFHIKDKDILNAIFYHTFGRPQMSKLEKIIFVADYIEPNRDFKEAKKARKKAEESLDKAMAYIVKKTLIHLVKNDKKVFLKAVDTYNESLNY